MFYTGHWTKHLQSRPSSLNLTSSIYCQFLLLLHLTSLFWWFHVSVLSSFNSIALLNIFSKPNSRVHAVWRLNEVKDHLLRRYTYRTAIETKNTQQELWNYGWQVSMPAGCVNAAFKTVTNLGRRGWMYKMTTFVRATIMILLISP